MEKLLKSIAEAIQAAAEKEQGLPPWQAAQEIADNCEVAARWVEMYEMGRPADAILTDLAREQEKAWEIIKGETESYRENARRNNPEFPDGMFSTKCAAIALPIIARYIERMEREKEPRLERLQLAQRLAKEVLEEYPETEIFGDEQSVRHAHFPILEEAFRDYTRLRKDAYSEEAFREKLRAKLAALEADTAEKLRLYNPEEAQPFVSDIRRPHFHKERQNERMDYLMALFRNTLLAEYLTALFPGDGQPEAGARQAQEEKPTTKVWALYYWYLQEAGMFDGLHKAKMATAKELAEKHGLSRQNFYQAFNAIGRPSHEKNPKRNPENIEKAIALLEGCPRAQQLAISELEKMKKGFTG